MSDHRAVADFYNELAEREEELEEARAHKDESDEARERWQYVSTAFAEWRREVRVLAGRPTGFDAAVSAVSAEEG